ncbi:cell division cycle-associated protein 2 [Silurus asotus]|uniref:Cell division cycle-associated protein 2 n=1 Tax=Silurus asotus TaxID=30991 RepID=A0AAD5ABH0_SILAS|nr:cell division cycle-associated protein 2 [Silurus asotus]
MKRDIDEFSSDLVSIMESEVGMETRTPLGPLTPSQQNGEGGAPDFSKLTASQFGITPSSFTSFPKDRDKSRVAQLKSRRRSSIGVRGSPETNSLICFRAKQVMKTPPSVPPRTPPPPRTPQHLLESPLFSGRDSIKQKMAAFQRLMETDEENTVMMKEEEEGVRHTQSDVNNHPEESENRLAPVTPPLSKRRRRGTPHRSAWEQQIAEEPLSEFTHAPKHEHEVEFKSPKMVQSLGLGLDSQSQLLSLPMLSKPELIKTGEADVSSASKKKRVRFGAPLSPEFFDKTLPPSTPLQKGATPACPPSSTGRKHSLLKTPQRFESLPQPDFSSPAGDGASPALNTHSYCNRGDTDEVFLDFQKIAFPIMDEEYDNPPGDSTASAEIVTLAAHHDALSTQTETTDAAVREDEGSHISCTAAPEHPDHPPTAEPELGIEQEEQHQLLETPQFSIESSTEAPRSRGRKRKQPAKSETTEARRSSRSAAESAKGKIKTSSAKKRFGAKEVDRSLYGKRDYASKNPLLSPIVESAASSLSCTPTQPRADENPVSISATAFNTNQSESASSGTTADLVAAAALWRRRFLQHTKDTESAGNQSAGSEGPVPTVQSETEVKSKRGRPARGRRNSAGRRQSWGGARVLDECEDGDKKSEVQQTESNQEIRKTEPRGRKRPGRRSRSVAETQEELEQRGLEKTCEDTVECAGDEKEEAEKNDEEMRQTAGHEVEEKKTEDVRQTSGTEEVKKNDMDMRETSEQKAEEKNHEDIHPSSVPLESLEAWQQPDFCIEDILKPVAKSRGSVRRSLRHRSSMDVLAKGLAWVEHTSPQMNTTNQRRTRGRLSAVSEPPPFPDEKPLETCL